MNPLCYFRLWGFAVPVLILGIVTQVSAQGLLENLKAFGGRLPAGDPEIFSTWEGGTEGPKGIAAGDLDQDGHADLAVGNLDGTVSVFFNKGDGTFEDPIHLHTPAIQEALEKGNPNSPSTLREIIIAKLTPGDDLPDIATCDLTGRNGGRVVVFPGGAFDQPFEIQTWPQARNLAAGDFDGDGNQELAVAGSGVGLRLYKIYKNPDGTLTARAQTELSDIYDHIEHEFNIEGNFSKPVYSLKAFRFPGNTRDEIVLTHAWANVVLVLSVGPTGKFYLPLEEVPPWRPVRGVFGAYDLDVGPITNDGLPDLVTVHRDEGTVQIRSGIPGPARFDGLNVVQTLQVPGGPRAVKIIDLDGDNWNDLVVVVRNLDLVLTFYNQGGTLVPGSDMPVGQSPRGLAVADYNNDGKSDAAVINRISQDVSILTAYPGEPGFSALNHLYLVDGQVVDLTTADLEMNGQDDVIQVHRASGEVSVRFAGPDGILQFPNIYPVGAQPSAVRVADMDNNDTYPDLVTANLGQRGMELGSISILLNDGTGHFQGNVSTTYLEGSGQLFSLEAGDFDGDGNIDIAAAYLDYRIGFFKGDGSGTILFTGEHEFANRAMGMAAGDFDGDGDLDLAGANAEGGLVVLENQKDFFMNSGHQIKKEKYFHQAPNFDAYGTRDLKAVDVNGDGDLDLIAVSDNGILVFRGSGGMNFIEPTSAYQIQAFSSVFCDMDGDGDQDLAVSGKAFSTVTVFRNDDGDFNYVTMTDVPSGRLLAAGDLDGDGQCDLLGSGDALWTALSKNPPERSAPKSLEGNRQVIEGLVINEFMAMNTLYRVGESLNKWDWLELFYSGPDEVLDLENYVLRRMDRDGQSWQDFLMDGLVIEKGEHLLLFCTKKDKPYHTGFKLPVTGAILVLLDPQGNEIDRISYPPQIENIAFSRYQDGHWSFLFNWIHSAGAPNVYNGTLSPWIRLEGVVGADVEFQDLFTPPIPEQPVRIFARAEDDVGVVSLRLFYGSAGSPSSSWEWIPLFDDGLHGDGRLQDGIFSNVLPWSKIFPSGGGSCISAEVMDPDGNVTEVPGGPGPEVGGSPGDERGGICLEVIEPEEVPLLRITEIVSSLSDNNPYYHDANGGSPDYVEIQNISGSPIPSLKDIALGERFPDYTNWVFLPDKPLGPGDTRLILCDRNLDQGVQVGEIHAPFELSAAEGGQLVLALNHLVGNRIIRKEFDRVKYPPLPTDRAWYRNPNGDGDDGVIDVPTPNDPYTPNFRVVDMGDVDENGVLDINDCVLILGYLFLDGEIDCPEVANVNGDDMVDITDAIYLLCHLFIGGNPPHKETVNCP